MGHYSQDRTRFFLPGELEGLWWLFEEPVLWTLEGGHGPRWHPEGMQLGWGDTAGMGQRGTEPCLAWKKNHSWVLLLFPLLSF